MDDNKISSLGALNKNNGFGFPWVASGRHFSTSCAKIYSGKIVYLFVEVLFGGGGNFLIV